jgi:ubiquinone/menaquinone biosynthesis C-methylase UbiE
MADFAESHQLRVTWFRERFGPVRCETTLDLACGSGDMTLRFARALPESHILAVDGSQAMLDFTTRLLDAEPELHPRVQLLQAFLPSDSLPVETYDLVMCHSALHHFHDPQVLWNTIRAHTQTGSIVFVSDLRRVSSVEEARQIVQERAANEHPALQRDFAASLCAAFTADEVRAQLITAGMIQLNVETIGDIYLLVHGVL